MTNQHDRPDTDKNAGQSVYISVREASEIAGKSPRTIRRWCKQGKVEADKSSGQWTVHLGDVRRKTGETGETESDTSGRIQPHSGSRLSSDIADKLIELSEENARLKEENKRLKNRLESGEESPVFRSKWLGFMDWLLP